MEDPLVRDGKRVPNSSSARMFPKFLFSLLIVLPIAVFILLPFTIVCSLFSRLHRMISPRPARGKPPPPSPEHVHVPQQRKYDIILLGATGFTGGIAAKYMATKYGSTVRWAIAGRKKSVLDDLQKKLGELAKSNEPICDVLVLDTLKEESLRGALPLGKVVISTVGPYARYGTLVVKVCAETGTHYCDITGETDWVRTMISTYSATAEETGARIVHFCGHDCIPWDLLVHSLSSFFSSKNEELKEVRCYDQIRSAPSGGTIETIFESIENRQKQDGSLGFDPLMLVSGGSGAQSEYKFKSTHHMTPKYSSEFHSWTGPFVMASVMGNCVKRSNAVNGYGPKLHYHEQMVHPNFFAAFVNVVTMGVFGMSLFCAPLRLALQKWVLPSPGQGPTDDAMEKGYLKVTAFGESTKGTKASTSIYFGVDPGYKDTARMIVESGHTLAFEEDRLQTKGGGVMTPAIGLTPVLLERLCATGCEFVEPKEISKK